MIHCLWPGLDEEDDMGMALSAGGTAICSGAFGEITTRQRQPSQGGLP
jgi:hypothetical protein